MAKMISQAPRFLVVGSGAIGITYTYLLSRNVPASNIFALCRSNYEAASRHGFKLNSTSWGQGLTVKPQIARSVEDAVAQSGGVFDYIIISLKSLPPFTAVPEIIRPAVTSGNTSIVLLQNGIGIEEAYAKAFPTNNIVSAVTYIKVTEVLPGVVEHTGYQQLHMGTFPAQAPPSHKSSVHKLASLFKSDGTKVVVHEDVQAKRWAKALVNATWNPICALTRLGDAAFLESDSLAVSLVRDIMKEVADAAKASGYGEVNDELIEFELTRNLERPLPGMRMSMALDAEAGKPMEIDAVLGNVVAAGRSHGLSMAKTSMLYLLLKGLDVSFKGKR